jgi:hypothetical protein
MSVRLEPLQRVTAHCLGSGRQTSDPTNERHPVASAGYRRRTRTSDYIERLADVVARVLKPLHWSSIMGNASGTTAHAKSGRSKNGHAKKIASGRSKDEKVLAKASAFMAEKPVIKPTTAVRKAGVTSPAAVERLSQVLEDREQARAKRIDKKTKAAATARPKSLPRRATPATERASPPNGEETQAGTSRKQIDVAHQAAEQQVDTAAALPVATPTTHLDGGGKNATPMGTDLVAKMAGVQAQFWLLMFQWSPLGVMLRHSVAAARLRRPEPAAHGQAG